MKNASSNLLNTHNREKHYRHYARCWSSLERTMSYKYYCRLLKLSRKLDWFVRLFPFSNLLKVL